MGFVDKDNNEMKTGDVVYNLQLPKCTKKVKSVYDTMIIINDGSRLSTDEEQYTQEEFLKSQWRKKVNDGK